MTRNPFTPVVLAAVLCVLCGYVAARASVAGEEFLPRLNDDAPALATSPRTFSEPHERPSRAARKVVVVIVDGLRLIDSYHLPTLDDLRRRGVDTSATSHYPTFSRPNYVTILTGVPPTASGVRNNYYQRLVTLDSLMDRARDAGLSAGFAGDVSPGPPAMFRAHTTGGYRDDFDDARFTPWHTGLVNAARGLLADDHELLVLLPGAVDDAGHEEGAESDEYRNAARAVDANLGQILSLVDLEQDAVIVVADHGHTDAGGHGGLEPEVVEVPLILAGAGIEEAAVVTGARLVDVAPTAAALLGLPPPGHGLGRTLTEALTLPDDTAEAIERADQRRIAANTVTLERWLADGRQAVTATRALRLPVAAVLLAVAIFGIWVSRRADAVLIDWRVMLLALPAFPLTYYALLGIFGQQYSPSVVPVRGSLVSELLRFGLLSTCAQVVVSWIALRGRVVLANRLAAANALTMFGLVSALIPAGLAWALFPGPFVDVPGPSLMVLVPAVYVAVTCYAVAVATTLGLELVIFFARAVDPRVRLRRLERAAERERERLRQETEA